MGPIFHGQPIGTGINVAGRIEPMIDRILQSECQEAIAIVSFLASIAKTIDKRRVWLMTVDFDMWFHSMPFTESWTNLTTYRHRVRRVLQYEICYHLFYAIYVLHELVAEPAACQFGDEPQLTHHLTSLKAWFDEPADYNMECTYTYIGLLFDGKMKQIRDKIVASIEELMSGYNRGVGSKFGRAPDAYVEMGPPQQKQIGDALAGRNRTGIVGSLFEGLPKIESQSTVITLSEARQAFSAIIAACRAACEAIHAQIADPCVAATTAVPEFKVPLQAMGDWLPALLEALAEDDRSFPSLRGSDGKIKEVARDYEKATEKVRIEVNEMSEENLVTGRSGNPTKRFSAFDRKSTMMVRPYDLYRAYTLLVKVLYDGKDEFVFPPKGTLTLYATQFSQYMKMLTWVLMAEWRLIPETYRRYLVNPENKALRHMLSRTDTVPVGGNDSIAYVSANGLPPVSTEAEIKAARDAFGLGRQGYAGVIQQIMRHAFF